MADGILRCTDSAESEGSEGLQVIFAYSQTDQPTDRAPNKEIADAVGPEAQSIFTTRIKITAVFRSRDISQGGNRVSGTVFLLCYPTHQPPALFGGALDAQMGSF